MVLATLAVILCLPLVHELWRELTPVPAVDRESPAGRARLALIARARVFVRPAPRIPGLELSSPPNDPEPFDPATLVECRYVPKATHGMSPKFFCRMPDGSEIKVKYGSTPERLGETAATRLLAALGFGADRVTLLRRLRCIGCPARPYENRKVAEAFFASWLLDLLISRDASHDFSWVSVERKLPGRAIEVGDFEGWEYSELNDVDPSQGGASRADVDALRLIAVFLGHWDSKAGNQRLLCDEGPGGGDPLAPCASPLLMLQDVGMTFGPGAVNESNWAATPIWADAGRCLVDLPHHNAPPDVVPISEAGRLLLAGKLKQLSDAQIGTLFKSAGFPDPATGEVDGHVALWMTTFHDKVRQIADRPPCPASKQ